MEATQDKVHRILAHSYSFYFGLFFLGVVLDLIFRIKIFTSGATVLAGYVFLALASLLIVWAQRTSRNLSNDPVTADAFYHGPYCYTRSPTHWGLFFLLLGFGLVTNALFVMILTIIAFIVTKLVFLRKEEEVLAQKYGTPYLEYKNKVRL